MATDLHQLQENLPAVEQALAAIVLAPGVTLKPITSFSLQADLVPVGAQAMESGNLGQIARLQAALVGLAWTGPGKPRAKYSSDPLAYGGAVLDELVERGLPFGAITSAGTMLFALAGMAFAKRAGVMERAAQQADFTGPPPAP